MPLVGTPTIKGVIKNARASGYNFTKAMGDIIDGSMTMSGCKEVHIKINKSSRNPDKIHSIKVSDNKITGMDSLQYRDSKHPLCWTRDSEEHDSDSAISEFGAGLKSAAVNLGGRLVFSTNRYEKETKYETYECDWEKMIEANTFDPTSIKQLNRDQFNKLHVDSNNKPLNHGTTFEISEIYSEFSPSPGIAEKDLKDYISNTYQFMDRSVYVNGEKIEYKSPYTSREDYPHQIYSIKIEVYKKDIIIHPISPNINTKVKNPKSQYMVYNKKDMKYISKSISKNSDYDDIKNTQKLKDTCIFRGTYIHGFSAESSGFCGGTVSISRNNRMLTIWSKDDPKYISFSTKFHMEQHYNYLNLNYNSKSTGKLLGISYTKSIDGNFPNNKLVAALGVAEKKLRTALGNSTSYKKRWQENNPYNIEWYQHLSYKDNVEMITKKDAMIAKQKQEEARIAKEQEKASIDKQKQEARIAKEQEKASIDKQKQEARIAKQKQEARIAKEQEKASIDKQKQEAIICKQQEEARIAKQQEDESIPKQTNDQKLVEKLESKPLNNQINIDIDSGAESIVVNTSDDEYTNNSQVIKTEIDTESKDDKESTDDSANNCIEVSCNSLNHSKVQDWGMQNYLGLYGCSPDGINIQNGNELKAKFGVTKQYPKKRANGGIYSKEKFIMISIDSVKINCELLLKIELEKIPGVKFSGDENFTFPKDKYPVVKKTYNNVVNDHLYLD